MIGIYKIFNTVTNSFYIGKSVKIENRFRAHKLHLRKGEHYNYKIQSDWNAHGPESFQFIVLEICSFEECLGREQHYLDTLQPDYNISYSSVAPMLGRKHKPETLEKFRNRKVLRGPENPTWGKPLSLEHREKLRLSRIGKKHSELTRKRQSETSKRLQRYKDLLPAIEKSKKRVIDNTGNEFKSMSDAATFWNISVQTVCDILKGRHTKTRKGVSFKYA